MSCVWLGVEFIELVTSPFSDLPKRQTRIFKLETSGSNVLKEQWGSASVAEGAGLYESTSPI